MLFFNPNLNLNFAQQVCQKSLNQNSTKSRTCRPNQTGKKQQEELIPHGMCVQSEW